MKQARLISGRVPVTDPTRVTSDRYQFLDLKSAEPNLGTAANNSVLVTNTLGQRTWTKNLNLTNANVDVNLTAGNIFVSSIFYPNGAPFISATVDSNVYNGRFTAGTELTLIDSVDYTGVQSVRWVITAKDNINNNYRSSTIDSVNNGTSVYYNEYGIVLSGNADVAVFGVDIDSGTVNLYAVGDSSSVDVTFQRTTLGSGTLSGAIPGAGYIQNSVGSGTATTCVNEVFTGTGAQTNFNLSVVPTDENQTLVSVGGVLQPKSAYAVAGSVLILSSAPANGVVVDVTIFVTTTVTGYTGSTGSAGYTGSTGSAGTVGYTGSVGFEGTSGYTGSQGTSGYTGSTGSIGYTGSVGPASATYASVNSNTSAVASTKYIVDTSSSSITITLPGSPIFGQEVGIIDGTGNADTNNITINGNGAKIQGSSSNMTVSTSRAAFTLVYYNSTHGWLLTNV